VKDLQMGVDTSGALQPFAQFLAEWLEVVKRERAPDTWRNYDQMCRVHILPALGRKRLAQVLPQDVDRMLRHAAQGGAADNTLRLIKATIRAALGRAVKLSLVPYNAASRADTPRGATYEHVALTREQAITLLGVCEEHPMGLLFILALLLGLRRGELLRLQWQHLDLTTGALEVQGTKSATSRRTLQVPESLLPRLRAHQLAQLQRRFDPTWSDEGYLFPGRGGKQLGDSSIERLWGQVREAAGLTKEVRLHDLRKTFATLQFDSGQSMEVVSRLLGHSGTAVTERVYVEVLQKRQAQALEDLSQYLGLKGA
jgi:integrase